MAKHDRPVGSKSTITATHWEAAALASAALTLCFCFIGIIWMIGWAGGVQDGADALRARAQVFTAGFASLAAVVTFCTVAWRAKVIERQADAQEQQLASTERQAESMDENNLALLLQKGAELIADENETKITAGIASLGAVALAENERFATEALNLLGKFIEHKHRVDQTHHLFEATANILSQSAANNRHKSVVLTFDGAFSKVDKPKPANWIFINKINRVIYKNGIFDGRTAYQKEINRFCYYEYCTFRFTYVIEHIMATKCCFFDSKIELVPNQMHDSSFIKCNFSEAKFNISRKNINIAEIGIKNGENYYYRRTPPTFSSNALREAILPLLEPRH